MTVRAKFVCNMRAATPTTGEPDGYAIGLTAVYQGEGENAEFFKYTPSGSITMSVVNPKAAEQFEVGKEYYVDFSLVSG